MKQHFQDTDPRWQRTVTGAITRTVNRRMVRILGISRGHYLVSVEGRGQFRSGSLAKAKDEAVRRSTNGGAR